MSTTEAQITSPPTPPGHNVQTVSPPPISYTRKAARQIISGGSAGLVEISIMHPLDVVKTRFQVQRGPDDPTRYKSYSDCVKKMIRNEGPLSFYKGVLPPLMAETPKRATKFFTFEQYKSLLTRNRDATAMTYIIAGTGSGITEGIMITPFERVKISLQSLRSHIRDTPGTFSHARVIISKDGFGLNGLYKGLGATVWRHGVWNAIYFGFYHNMKGFFISSESPSISKRLALGTIAGTIASTANIPFDVAKSRIQGPPPNGDILKYRTTLQTIGVVFKEEGYEGHMHSSSIGYM